MCPFSRIAREWCSSRWSVAAALRVESARAADRAVPRRIPVVHPVGIVAAAICLSAQLPIDVRSAQPTASAFQSGVDLVLLHVTVTDAEGRYLTDVKNEEFLVFEKGRKQQLEFVQKGGLPLAVTLLLDTSSSVQHAFAAVQHAAIRFLRELGPLDIGSVITFADAARVLCDFTAEHGKLQDAVRRAKPRGSTALYNGIYIGLKELAGTAAVPITRIPRRRAAIVLSDGEDTSSLVGFQDVLDLAARTDTIVYTIAFDRRDTILSGPAEATYVLRQLASQTGGRAFFPAHRYELPRVYEQISAELSSHYTLGYVSNDTRSDGRFRSLSVQVMRGGASARTRRGYFAAPK